MVSFTHLFMIDAGRNSVNNYIHCTYQCELCLRQLASSPSLSDLVREQKSHLCEHTLSKIHISTLSVNCIFS